MRILVPVPCPSRTGSARTPDRDGAAHNSPTGCRRVFATACLAALASAIGARWPRARRTLRARLFPAATETRLDTARTSPPGQAAADPYPVAVRAAVSARLSEAVRTSFGFALYAGEGEQRADAPLLDYRAHLPALADKRITRAGRGMSPRPERLFSGERPRRPRGGKWYLSLCRGVVDL
jgi:hypothetical protein